MKDENNNIAVSIRACRRVDDVDIVASTDHEEWQAPTSSQLYTGNQRECYIKGVANENYAVHFEFLTGYDPKEYPAVYIRILIDDTIKACYLQPVLKTRNAQQNVTYHTKQKQGQTVKPLFSFDGRRLVDREKLGSIVVTIQRTTATYKSNSGSKFVGKDSKLEEGQEMTFKFFYASTPLLRNLGIPIPRPQLPTLIAGAKSNTSSATTSPTEARRRLDPAKADEGATKTPTTPAKASARKSSAEPKTPASKAPQTPTYVAPSANMTPSALQCALSPSRTSISDPFTVHPGSSAQNIINAVRDLPPIDTALGQHSIPSPTQTPLRNGAGLLDTPATTATPVSPALTTPVSKRKKPAPELGQDAFDWDVEQSPAEKKFKTSLPDRTSIPRSTPFDSSTSAYGGLPVAFKTETPTANNDDDDVVCIGNRNRHEEQKKKEEQLKFELEQIEADEQYELEEMRIKREAAKKKMEARKKHLFGGN